MDAAKLSAGWLHEPHSERELPLVPSNELVLLWVALALSSEEAPHFLTVTFASFDPSCAVTELLSLIAALVTASSL